MGALYIERGANDTLEHEHENGRTGARAHTQVHKHGLTGAQEQSQLMSLICERLIFIEQTPYEPYMFVCWQWRGLERLAMYSNDISGIVEYSHN